MFVITRSSLQRDNFTREKGNEFESNSSNPFFVSPFHRRLDWRSGETSVQRKIQFKRTIIARVGRNLPTLSLLLSLSLSLFRVRNDVADDNWPLPSRNNLSRDNVSPTSPQFIPPAYFEAFFRVSDKQTPIFAQLPPPLRLVCLWKKLSNRIAI